MVAHPKDLGIPLTVTAIRQMIAENMFDVQHPDDWSTGYIVGAISGLRQGDRREEGDEQAVQLGPLSLRLNNWRFCEGYSNGKLDYEQGQEGRISPDVLTACDLLRYSAHRDPETDRYHFGED